MKTLRIIDLFSGAGGFTLGFTEYNRQNRNVKFVPVWANDFNKDAVDLHISPNRGRCYHSPTLTKGRREPSFDVATLRCLMGFPPVSGLTWTGRRDAVYRAVLQTGYWRVSVPVDR